MRRRGWIGLDSLGLGAWIIVAIAVVSSLLLLSRPSTRRDGLQMWTRARTHYNLYLPPVAEWNDEHDPRDQVNMHLISDQALESRMMAGFLADTYVADLIELERRTAGRLFTGPVDAIGFVDLTDRLRDEGLLKQINAPSFGPWMSRGRIYGLPHDVHPVLLAYRADIVAEAGIDMNQVETWDDLERLLRPLIADRDGDGHNDRYILNMWHTNMDATEALILQAGGNYFDAEGRPTIATAVNAKVVARIIRWVCGPDRIAIDAPEFSAAGNQLRLDGSVVVSLVPDWLCGVWKLDMPALEGHVRLMPLPAWEPGGRRTTVWGGSMLGIARGSSNQETAWAFAKRIYLGADLAEQLYRRAGIITPVKSLWNLPVYDEPDPYFSGQPTGRLYINVAADVPTRNSSPYNMLAKARVQDAVFELREYALDNGVFEAAALEPRALELLRKAEEHVRRQMERNVFLKAAE